MKRTLSHILTSEGRVVRDADGDFSYHEYHMKDHLGNTRVVFTEDDGVIKNNDYYPFGMIIDFANEEPEIGSNDNKFLYNGKEFIKEIDPRLGWYDYGARMYDPQLGRFHSVDPKEEYYMEFTPYHYCMNNPILYVDLNGECVTITYGDGETYTFCGDASDAPDDPFVQSVIEAYNIMVEAGGGSFVDLVTNKGINAPIRQFDPEKGDVGNSFERNEAGNEDKGYIIQYNNEGKAYKIPIPDYQKGTIVWNPNGGLLTEGGVLTPVEMLEHEGDHSLVEHTLPAKKIAELDYNWNYDIEIDEYEARAVIKESDMARRNGCASCPRKTYGEGSSVITTGINSRIINQKKTKQWRETLLKRKAAMGTE